jgi:hypothetical protein
MPATTRSNTKSAAARSAARSAPVAEKAGVRKHKLTRPPKNTRIVQAEELQSPPSPPSPFLQGTGDVFLAFTPPFSGCVFDTIETDPNPNLIIAMPIEDKGVISDLETITDESCDEGIF